MPRPLLPEASTPARAVVQHLLVAAAAVAVAFLTAWRGRAVRGADETQPPGGPLPGDEGALFWMRAAAVLSVVVPLAVFLGVVIYGYEAAYSATQRRMERLASIAHEHAQKVLDTNEVLVSQVNLLTGGLSSEELRRNGPQLHAQLAQMARGLPQLHSIWVVDERGDVLLSSRFAALPAGLSVAQGAPFLALRAGGPDTVVIAPPRIGPMAGEPSFDLSRRRPHPDGSFAGITTVALQPGYFADFYRDLADQERGIVLTLLHRDGYLLARWPDPQAPAGAAPGAAGPMLPPMARNERSGFVQGPSSDDGKRRYGAFRRVGNYPVYVYAGIDEDTAMAGWRRDVAALASFILPMTACLVLVTLLALRRTRQQLEATRRLRQESQERQRVEAVLHQSQKMEAMGHLTGGVAHDFNNLLMVVNLNVALLKRRLANPDDEKPLEAIQRAVAAGKKLTRQLLAFSHRQPLLPRRLDFAEAMPTLLDLIRPALGSRVGAEGEVEPGTRCVMLDSGELELAMINLAVNAKDAMPDGGEVRLHVRNAGDFVELSFADTGPGIAPELVQRVFEPFFTTKPVGKGTGLGLSQVYGLCKRAGGDARIESAPGRGTTVILRFPAVAGEGEAVDEEPAAEIERVNLRVLMVEDNGDIANATRELLGAAGCTVTHCDQAQAALGRLAAGERYDVVLSDIVMPGMDGLALAARIRSDHPQLPLVLMTGYAGKLHEAESRGLIVLPKPFEPGLLLRTLQAQVRRTNGDAAAGAG